METICENVTRKQGQSEGLQAINYKITKKQPDEEHQTDDPYRLSKRHVHTIYGKILL